MANDILNSEIFQTQKSEKKTISTKPASETKKEGSSLFDSLLKDAKTKVDEGKVASKVNSQAKPIAESITAKQTTGTTATIQKDNKLVDTKLNSSFQSKTIVNESSKDVPSTNLTKTLDIVKEKGIEHKIDVKTTSKLSVETDKTKTDMVENKIVQKPIQKEEVTKGEHKAPLSLLDKMVQDAKKASQTTLVTEDKNLKIATPIQKEEVAISKVAKENQLEKKEVIHTDKIVKTVDEKIKPTLPETNKVIKKEIIKETLIQKDQTSTSLLNKKVQDIADSKIEEGEEKKDIKKSEPKIVAKSEENIGKLFLELNDGIKLEKTPKEANLEIKESKETKILSSLADSLNGKTKIQKKVDETTKLENLQDSKGQFGANVFLSNQKVQGELLSKQKLTEAKEVLKDGEKTTKTVKKSADILELNAKSIELTSEVETPNIAVKSTTNQANNLGLHTQQAFLNRIFLNQEKTTQIVNSKVIEEKVAEIKVTNEDVKKMNNDVTITVERNLVETFTTKVIASKQAMGSFMSDVARNMYLNYKPPVTAFKINIDPLNLGSIAIVMRSNKSDNTLSVSLNMSQNGTLDTFNDNKSALQNALGRVFNQNESNISLDFGMQSDSSNQEFEQQRQNEQNKEIIQNRNSKEALLEKDEQSIDLETTKSYM